jgi:hypothetical protein
VAIDVRMVAGLGRFFANKLRAGVAYALFTRTQARGYLEEGVSAYRAARDAWVDVVEEGRVYRDDITVGGEAWLRGQWADRLPAIEDDLNDMEAALAAVSEETKSEHPPLAGLDPVPPDVRYTHTPPPPFKRGRAVSVLLTAQSSDGATLAVRLHYRHLNQAEAYETVEMEGQGGQFRATIPGAYTDSAYPLVYSFEVRAADGNAWPYPGLNGDLANAPYFVVRQAIG